MSAPGLSNGQMTGLPTGTVAMLFSDIEGSTRLLRTLGDRWPEVLGLQRRVCRDAWAGHDGHEIGTEGDSFFVAFATAHAAVRAATAAQLGLSDCVWPSDGPVRVRMGIHTGTPTVYEDGYAGLDVHRAARIAGTAHGGQVIVSEVTASSVRGTLDPSVHLRDLGRHRLKDLPAPEHLFQLEIAGLPSDFPPLRSLGTSSTLPRPGGTLIGRRHELAELETLVSTPGVSLVTLTGAGGSGKTRLAIGLAHQLVERFPGGAYFVPLAAATTLESAWATLGEVLDVPAEGRMPPRVFEHLASLDALCVLDNLEQLDGADRLLAELLQGAPAMTFVVTSRHPLHLATEYQHPVPPLALPEGESLAGVESSDAVQLFVQRARQVRPHFELTADNAADVAAACRRLDGLPLAIELAAARSNLLSPAAMLVRLGEGLDISSVGRDRPDRQKTLRVTLDWSYELLPTDRQRFFRHLGVFAGGADLEAVAAVSDLDDESEDVDLYELLAELVDASLVVVVDSPDEDFRIGMLETVRAYARDRMRAEHELDVVQHRHAGHYLELATRLGPISTVDQQLTTTLGRFERDLDNFRAALAWALPPGTSDTPADRAAEGLRLCAALGPLWYVTGNFAEAREWQEAAIRHADGNDSPELARCLTMQGSVLHEQGRELEQAARFRRAAVGMWRRLEDQGRLAFALSMLGATVAETGDRTAARALLEEAVALAREAGGTGPLSWTVGYLAYFESCERNLPLSLELYDEALDVSRAHGDPRRAWLFTMGRACAVRLLGRAEQALDQLSELIPSGLRTNNPQTLAVLAECCAAALSQLGRWSEAVRLLGAADATRDRLTTCRLPLQDLDVLESLSSAREGLVAQDWEDAYRSGRDTPLPVALAELRA